MTTPRILPTTYPLHSHRTGSLHGIGRAEIEMRLGFPPNVEDDESRVTASWQFTIDGSDCAIWDYLGSAHLGWWSTFGPRDALRMVFGEHVRN